ncbi:hypothetical protein BGX34_008947 [Mortierella sp. NVP85]|nr:hypothetical protein BGX34_008947 [Mortierella sp. NVP85]
MLSTQIPSLDLLDPFAPPSRPVRSFTRLAKAGSSSNLPSTETLPITHNDLPPCSTSSRVGLQRFKPSLPSLDSLSSDFASDPATHLDEPNDIHDVSLLPLTLDTNQTAERPTAHKVAAPKPRPTFTRITPVHTNPSDTTLRNNAISNYPNTNTNSRTTRCSDGPTTSDRIAQLDDMGMQHSTQSRFGVSSSLRQDKISSPAKVSRLSLTLPLSLSPPPSAAPSLSSASTSCSSSSPISTSSPSPPWRSVLPREAWWPSPETPSKHDQVAPESRPIESESDEDEAEPVKQDLQESNDDLDTRDDTLLSLQHGFQRIKPRTYIQSRTRFSALPPVFTGFCSISQTPIATSGEPSPQDFLGEADVPYPLPSTLQERQARQQKRAEQLRQLEIHEERESLESCRRIQRRRASYSAGMDSPLTAPHAPPSLSLSTPVPMARSISAPETATLSNQKQELPQTLIVAADPLKRSPSSPINMASRKSRHRVRFDLRKTRIVEYEILEEWKPCSRSPSPTAFLKNQPQQVVHDLKSDVRIDT